MTEDDWPALLEWNQDRMVLIFWDNGHTQPWSLTKLQNVYRAISRQAFLFILEKDGQPIGEAWLQRLNREEIRRRFPDQDLRRIDLSIGRPDLWGQGLGTEAVTALVRFAFDEEHVDAVFACDVSDRNPASRRLFERIGFTDLAETRSRGSLAKEGITRHLVLTRQRWCDRKSPSP